MSDWEPELTPDPRTEYIPDSSRTVLTYNDSPDVGFNASVNPYRGCEHGCIYCYARPTHEYLGLSAGVDFETRIFVKLEAPKLLREALLKPSYEPQVINLSGVTDCYQPAEKIFELTRGCLKVLQEFKNPFTIITKNFQVTRDIDIISEMASRNQAAVFVSVTTLDEQLCGKLEPRTSRPQMRLQAIRRLAEVGIPVGVMIAPVIPGITDSEILPILDAVAQAGARFSGFVPLRLPYAVSPLFQAWLGEHFPDRKEKVLHRIESLRGGKLNDPQFGSRMRGQGQFAHQIKQMHEVGCKRTGINSTDLELSTAFFARPGEQMKLF